MTYETDVQLPDGLTTLEAEALSGTGCEAVIVPRSCTKVEEKEHAPFCWGETDAGFPGGPGRPGAAGFHDRQRSLPVSVRP